jgi:hypothetical protein
MTLKHQVEMLRLALRLTPQRPVADRPEPGVDDARA